MVTFRYKKTKSHRWRTMALDAMEFIRRFLQHVLPTGFMKIRYYGFMSPSCSVSHDKLKPMIELSYGFNNVALPETQLDPLPEPVCTHCGDKLKYIHFILPQDMMFMVDTG